ncbi:tripartite tricarboxylate transporter substrate binding protein [Ramlibacter sp. AW1]|uniref:Tripartite tricarboxylate transporter substrate binding protein n=1 Tax=Ramlibacter aurantiacus TaxID=2801330 RepID=A0A937D613_9BURK|nr:tripartite tricarboxylate transporter substrate binding protein [Ramlibacter aurantiacus]MBL0421867.1 tripartite tricarboxylate transporter substrate binding protein [Ramlibacter aurantiacus]
MTKGLFARMILLAALALPGLSWAAYPERPIRLVVPFPAGGTTDVVARQVARNMSATLGQEIIVDNRGGAATIIGVDTVAKAAPDGYTILLATATSFSVNPHTYKNLPYRLDEFLPIGFISEAPIVLVAPPSQKAKSLPELVQALKAAGVETPVATTGKGGFSHLTAAMFFNAIDARFRDVPYRGEAPALQDVLAGQVGLYFGSMPGTLPHVSAGRLRGFAVTSVERSPSAPDIPSFTELRIPEVVATSWFGLAAPKGTPANVIATLGAALTKAVQDPDLLARMAKDGAVTRSMSPAEFAEYIRTDNERWGRIVRAANIEQN